MKRAWWSVAVFAVILSYSHATVFGQTPKRGGTLTIGFKEEPDRLDARYRKFREMGRLGREFREAAS